MAETMTVGVVTTLVGMGVVFAVLIILSFTTWMLNKIVELIDKKPQNSAPATAERPIATVETTNQNTGIDAKVIAAIATAIAAVTGTPVGNLKFTAIQRVGSTPLPWAQASHAEIMNNRQRFTEGGNR
jgi:sodium pump decarboxylase gamma subunit